MKRYQFLINEWESTHQGAIVGSAAGVGAGAAMLITQRALLQKS